MKKMDIFCSSPSSTAICSSLDHRSMVRHGTTRPKSKCFLSCSSHPTHSSSSSSAKQTNFDRSKSYNKNNITNNRDNQINEFRRKSSADITDVAGSRSSSRYLLNDKVPYIDWISESDAVIIDPPYHHSKSSNNQSPALKSSSSPRSRDQVVVLWVSIHCKGCEGKLRKHISKMEGVRSFSIDLATKKVTVIGNVSPLGVLASVSKVKNAQLWPYQSSSTPSPSS